MVQKIGRIGEVYWLSGEKSSALLNKKCHNHPHLSLTFSTPLLEYMYKHNSHPVKITVRHINVFKNHTNITGFYQVITTKADQILS